MVTLSLAYSLFYASTMPKYENIWPFPIDKSSSGLGLMEPVDSPRDYLYGVGSSGTMVAAVKAAFKSVGVFHVGMPWNELTFM